MPPSLHGVSWAQFPRFGGVGSEEAPTKGLASVRRSNGTCRFPAYRFHKGACGRELEGISRDQANKTILAVGLALGESPVAPASPPLIAMGMDTPNDPAIPAGAKSVRTWALQK